MGWRGLVPVIAALTMAGTGCSSGGLPNPFAQPLPHAHVVVDKVDCDPTPDLCTRYVVLRREAISTAGLMTLAEARMRTSLRWRPTRYPEVIEYDMGAGFDGPKAHSPGGTINTVTDELHYWNRVGFTSGSPPPTPMLAIMRAMESTPGGVVVAISGG